VRGGYAPPLEHPVGARLLIARPGSERFSSDEAVLLRGMARVASMTMRMLRVLDDERLERAELERLTNDRAALRQVATLVAKAAPREDIYAAVASEVAQLLDADVAAVLRYEGDGTARIVGCGAAEGCRSQWALVWRIARGLRSPSSRRADRLVSGAFTDCSVRSRTLSAASALWAVDRRRGRYLGSRVRRVVSPRSATRAERWHEQVDS